MGGLVGIFSGDKGSQFQAGSTPIQSGVDPSQLSSLYGQAQGGLGQQQAFVNALNAQNGIGNLGSVFSQQQDLANQLNLQAQGGGPNPALAMLNQATGQNVANQAALLGSQRGVSQNPALIGRQAAQVGANTQQQAASQGAILQAQQQLAAQQQLSAQQTQMAGVAGNQIGYQAGALNNLNQGTQSEQQLLQSALANKNAQNVAMQSNINNANSGVAQVNAGTQGNLVGSLISGTGAAVIGKAMGGIIGNPGFHLPVAHMLAGGRTPFMAGGGEVGPQSVFGQYLASWPQGGDTGAAPNIGMTPMADLSGVRQSGQKLNSQMQQLGQRAGDYVRTDHSTPQTDAGFQMPQFGGAGNQVAGSVPTFGAPGSYTPKPYNFELGGKIPGQAREAGDSYSNDTVPIMASPGEIVLPRSITMGPNAAENAAAFVQGVLHGRKMHAT